MNRLLPIVLAISWIHVCNVQASEPARPKPTRPPVWDTHSDTWVATDALGRALPGFEECGPPRRDRSVGIFYFLWLGAHVNGGPYDITKILLQDPDAMQKKGSPLWGPMHVPHHWGESLFGYYLTDDAYVLRKHAQMFADAGVDTLVFDVTNQITYRKYYMDLLRVFSEVRRNGGKTPQVAFLCPFWDPAKVVAELYRDLYEPGLYRDLWFRWEGKPLILADPQLLADARGNTQRDTPVALSGGHTLGQSFTVDGPFDAVGGSFPTWNAKDSALTLSLHREGPQGERVATRRFESVGDNAWQMLRFSPALPSGTYYLEMSAPKGTVGWWSHTRDVFQAGQGRAYADGTPDVGDRTLRICMADGRTAPIREFFTFRKPQPDYFRGPTGPDMWSWLEIYPQHVFKNSRGQKEQMSVGVAQNAVGDRLATMSEPGARGRSFHNGATAREVGAVIGGYNVAEQWTHALKEDPRFIFITGWNEWIAGRYAEFGGVRLPVMFVDSFDQEHSRDIEPMRGGHGDAYYWQMIAHIRRYKGVRPRPPASTAPITVDGQFDDWNDVRPEYRDDVGDPARRNHPGYGSAGPYVNTTGRNDLIAAKVSWDAESLFFYARTREPLSPHTDANWMLLLVDTDADATTGWLGYDFVVNGSSPTNPRIATLRRHAGNGYRWGPPTDVAYRAADKELELAIPWAAMGIGKLPAAIDFKWADGIRQTGEASDFTLNGDAAPNDRFNYRATTAKPAAP